MMGVLSGYRIIEMAGIGPAPFCAMMLADMGADVIRIDRKKGSVLHPDNPVNRNRRSVALDLKKPDSINTLLRLIEGADALLEGFRPGVMERLGLGPDICLQANPGLVYGRMTGWGQTGPLAKTAGHDINYIALTGALHSMAPSGEAPRPPLNLIGDYGGGGMLLAVGLLAAMLEAGRSGKGQVVDAAMTDGSASLMTLFYGLKAAGQWSSRTGSNMLDGGAHFYGCYTCKDGRHIAIGAIEPQFYSLLLEKCGITDPDFSAQMDPAQWPLLREKLSALFVTRTREQWCELLEGTDACFAPVLDMAEAPAHPHNQQRKTFIDVDGVIQPAPAPRFSRTPSSTPRSPVAAGSNDTEILGEAGLSPDEIAGLRASGAVS